LITGGYGLFAQSGLPLSFNLVINPDADGTLTEARIYWQRSDRIASTAGISYLSASEAGNLPGYGDDSLYSLSTGDGKIVINPFVFSGTFNFIDWTVGAGLGFKTEIVEEKGNYQSLGTQAFDNRITSWRLGTPLSGEVFAGFGPVNARWTLTITPFMFYSLSQIQESSLLTLDGELKSNAFIGPELINDLRIGVFSLSWISIHHEFLWLSVPHLAVNEYGDAWISEVEGYTNQILRILAGVSLRTPMGALDVGIGWKRNSSKPDNGSETMINDGLIFELNLSAGSRR